jgi:hypothetical protein
VEIFEPPYLFRGPRPSIVSAPAQGSYGRTFSIQTKGSPTRAVLMSPGATTHGNDMNQRHVELAVTPTDGGLSATAPANANLAPPGDYMLFVLQADGVPSVARWVRLGSTTSPPPPRPNQAPTASFTAAPGSPRSGQTVSFSDTSTDADGTIATRAWDLDDDGQYDDGAGATAARAFTAAGGFTVRLQVTDDDGARATASRQVANHHIAPLVSRLRPAGPLRLRLSVLEGSRGPAPRTVRLRIGASHRVSARFVVVELGRWARARGRLVLKYRRATATTVRGQAAGARLQIRRRGVYRVRLTFRDGGRLRHAGGVTLVAV